VRIYACSDLHVSPTHFSDAARAFLQEGRERADLTLLCGDIYEGIWYPLEESVRSDRGQELWSLIESLPRAVLLLGNHDWSLRDYLAGSRHPVVKSYQFDGDGRSYYATHGWIEYDLALSLLAPIYTWLFPRLPWLLRWWTGRRSPRALKLGVRSPLYWHHVLEAQRRVHDRPGFEAQSLLYWRYVREMANQAIFQAISEDCVPIWGHSHRRHIDPYARWLAINCGDFCEDDLGGVVIEDGVARLWRGKPLDPKGLQNP